MLACKNSINRQVAEHTGMFRVFSLHPAAQLDIFGRTVSGKGQEIPIEVRLIVELGLMSNARQIERVGRVKRAKDVGKPVETRDFLGRNTHESFELVAQMVLAETDLIAQRPDGQCAMILSD